MNASRYVGGDDFQHGVDRFAELSDLAAWNERQYNEARMRDMIRRPWLYDNDDPREWSAGLTHTQEFGEHV